MNVKSGELSNKPGSVRAGNDDEIPVKHRKKIAQCKEIPFLSVLKGKMAIQLLKLIHRALLGRNVDFFQGDFINGASPGLPWVVAGHRS